MSWRRVLLFAALVLVGILAAAPACAFADECPAGGNHSWHATIERNATEDEDGLWLFTCSKCGATYTKAIPATGHLWGDWIVEIEPTCTSEGREYRVCTRYPDNPHYEYRVLPMLSPTGQHDWREETRVEPICTGEGSITYVCAYCGETHAVQLPALGHDWGEWTVTRQPTASEPGMETRICSRDATHVETREVPATGEAVAEPVSAPETPDAETPDAATPDAETVVSDVATPGAGAADDGGGPGFLAADFLTAGPDMADAVMAGADLIFVAAFALSSVGLIVQLVWVRNRRRKAYEQASGRQGRGDGE